MPVQHTKQPGWVVYLRYKYFQIAETVFLRINPKEQFWGKLVKPVAAKIVGGER
jgi:hypothetical protein